jgi:hypothetical protein
MPRQDRGWVVGLVAGLAASFAAVPPLRAGVTTAPTDDEVVARWTFDTQAGADAWTAAHDCEKLGIKDEALQLKLTGPDAYVFAPVVRARMDGCAVRVRMRADRTGITEVFWTTDKTPAFSEQQKTFLETAASKGFETREFVLGGTADADRYLTGFRIDPYNGNREGLVEIDSVELVRLRPVFDVRFAAADARAGRGDVTLRVSARQTAGRSANDGIAFAVGDEPATPCRVARAGEEVVHQANVSATAPGVHRFTSRATVPGQRSYILESCVSQLGPESLPEVVCVKTDQIRLELIRDARTEGQYGAARLWLADGKGKWIEASLLQPLATVMIKGTDALVRRCPSLGVARLSDDAVQLGGVVTEGGGKWRVAIEMQVTRDHGEDIVRVQAWLTAEQGGDLCKFAGPTVLVGRSGEDPLERCGLFGGLEFLESGWSSSSDRAVGEKFAKRWTPHPHKITLPLMAIEQNGVTTAMMWQPMKNWAREHTMPAATFASPNFLDAQPNHLMELFVPNVPEWTSENGTYASRPYHARREELLRVEYVIVAGRKTSVVSMARRWYEIFGAPEPPPSPHDAARTYELCMQNFGETMYWPDEKGWRHHMYLDQRSGFHPFMAGELLSHAARSGNDKWVMRTNLAGRSIVETLGPIASRLARPSDVQGTLASQRADGTWAFKNTPRMMEQTKEFTHGKYADLGEDGSTCLGTTVMPALPILRHALITGDPDCVKAGLRALEAMNRFRVPRGAQVWEVPELVPDIRAAALAVEAYRMGFQLTGQERWLDEAQYWAWTGVPFLYAWHVPIETTPAQIQVSRSKTDWSDRRLAPAAEGFGNPNRQVTPYATIPVFGTTFYVIGWFGNVVQWCGLEWAYQVLDLLEFRPDPLLKAIADGVVCSGEQQMLDREPWVGLYPDVWDLGTNSALGAYISAVLPLQCLRAQGNAPADAQVWARVLRPGGRTMHVSGWGRVMKVACAGRELVVECDFAPGQVNELVIVGADKPSTVRVGEEVLPAGDGENHWQYRPEERAMVLRVKHRQAVMKTVVRWPMPAATRRLP